MKQHTFKYKPLSWKCPLVARRFLDYFRVFSKILRRREIVVKEKLHFLSPTTDWVHSREEIKAGVLNINQIILARRNSFGFFFESPWNYLQLFCSCVEIGQNWTLLICWKQRKYCFWHCLVFESGIWKIKNYCYYCVSCFIKLTTMFSLINEIFIEILYN